MVYWVDGYRLSNPLKFPTKTCGAPHWQYQRTLFSLFQSWRFLPSPRFSVQRLRFWYHVVFERRKVTSSAYSILKNLQRYIGEIDSTIISTNLTESIKIGNPNYLIYLINLNYKFKLYLNIEKQKNN